MLPGFIASVVKVLIRVGVTPLELIFPSFEGLDPTKSDAQTLAQMYISTILKPFGGKNSFERW